MLRLKKKQSVQHTSNVIRGYFPNLTKEQQRAVSKLVRIAVREGNGLTYHCAERIADGFAPMNSWICKRMYKGKYDIMDTEILFNDDNSIKDVRCVIKSKDTYDVIVDRGRYLETMEVKLVLVFSIKTFTLISAFTNDANRGMDFGSRKDLYFNV